MTVLRRLKHWIGAHVGATIAAAVGLVVVVAVAGVLLFRAGGTTPSPAGTASPTASGEDSSVHTDKALLANPLLAPAHTGGIFIPRFPPGTHLLSNELAFREPAAKGARLTPDWVVTSGSLFSRDGVGWTGVPDATSPNIDSSNGNNSAVFRLVTRRSDFRDVRVRFQLRVSRLTEAAGRHDYDGVHIFLRYQSDKYLYTATVFRRDNLIVVKKKTPGGTANGGTYVALAQTHVAVPTDRWVPVEADITTTPQGYVQVKVTISGRQALTALDHGVDGPPILASGRVGLRGDNCDFEFRDFEAIPH